MATASTCSFVPVNEYLKANYEPHCEYPDGVLAPEAVPDYIHSKFQQLLILYLASQQSRFGSLMTAR